MDPTQLSEQGCSIILAIVISRFDLIGKIEKQRQNYAFALVLFTRILIYFPLLNLAMIQFERKHNQHLELRKNLKTNTTIEF